MRPILITLVGALAIGCSASDAPSPVDQHQQFLGMISLDVILVDYNRKAPEEQLSRAESLLSLLSPLEHNWSTALTPAAERLRASDSDGTLDEEAAGATDLKISFRDGRYVSATNSSLTRDRRLDAGDIGATAARALAEEVASTLAQDGLLQAEHYDFENATLGRVKFGAALNDEIAVQHVKEYRFYVQSAVNGIHLSDGEFRVGIHRTGSISHVRIGAPEILDVSSDKVTRTVTDAQLDQRFESEYPSVQLHSVEMQYPISSSLAGEQRVEPRRAYTFSPVVESENGMKAFGRRMTVYYSVTDADAKPTTVPESAPSEDASSR